MNQIDNIMAGIKPDTHCWDDDTGKDVWSYSEELVRAAIEQALAVQPKQEPVAWMHRSNDMHFMKEKPLGEIGFLFVPLYTHPKPKEETVQKPVAWEYRYKESNPHTVNYGKWGEWERLVPRNALETVEGRVAEMNQYIATGYSYEVRALYDSPLVQKGRDEALAVQPQQETKLPEFFTEVEGIGNQMRVHIFQRRSDQTPLNVCSQTHDTTPYPHLKAMQQALDALHRVDAVERGMVTTKAHHYAAREETTIAITALREVLEK